jgi:mRNA deadenylase 3'-5' endonuclease subunit Ccr4
MMEKLTKIIPHEYYSFIKNKPLIQFKKIKLNNKSSNGKFLSFMTWNTLASGYTSPSVYYYTKPNYLNENHRMNMISYDILNNDCDIVCLQELEKRCFQNYFESVDYYKSKYNLMYEKRPGLTCDGLGLMYKKENFKQVYSETLNLNTFTSVYNKIHPKIVTNNITQFFVLEPVNNNYKNFFDYILISNLHLHWDPKKELIKYSQMSEILKKVNEIYVKFSDKSKKKVPIFICGDYNSLPNSNVVDLIKGSYDMSKFDQSIQNITSQIFQHTKETISNNFKLLNTHEANNDVAYLTNIKPDFRGKIDHIFFSNNLDTFKELEVSQVDTSQFIEENALPNSFHGSDHIYLVSKFYV